MLSDVIFLVNLMFLLLLWPIFNNVINSDSQAYEITLGWKTNPLFFALL